MTGKWRQRIWSRLASYVARRLEGGDPDHVREWVCRVVSTRAASLPPDVALRFLLGLEDRLSLLDDQAAIRLDGGVHVKHRLMGYHAFFVRNITALDRVLDVGCSIGVLAAEIAERTGARVTGVDINAQSIERARTMHRLPNLEFFVGDATVTLPAGPFSVVVLSNVLEHIDDRLRFLRGLQASTGATRYLIRVPVFERDWRVPLRRELGMDWRSDPTHETEYTLESFAAEMAAAGLQIVRQESRWSEIWAECGVVGKG